MPYIETIHPPAGRLAAYALGRLDEPDMDADFHGPENNQSSYGRQKLAMAYFRRRQRLSGFEMAYIADYFPAVEIGA